MRGGRTLKSTDRRQNLNSNKIQFSKLFKVGSEHIFLFNAQTGPDVQISFKEKEGDSICL